MIRRMAGADLDDIAKIWLESNLEAHEFVPADYWRGKFDEVREQIAHAEVYVYEDGGGVEGFARALTAATWPGCSCGRARAQRA